MHKYTALSAAILASLAAVAPAHALTWDWNYGAVGVSAQGTFTTTNTPDGSGFYLITAITGERNGVAITSLTAAGTGIPQNEAFPVDNLVSQTGGQLTYNGFGFGLSDGTYSNPYWDGANYYDFFSDPVHATFSEPAISFTATVVPEPAAWTMTLLGLGMAGAGLRRRRVVLTV